MRKVGPSREPLPAAVTMTLGLLCIALLAGVLSLTVQWRQSRNAAQDAATAMTGGDPQAGLAAMRSHGCGACHEIPGLALADGRVGPSLDKIATRAFIAGRLPNAPAAMSSFLTQPQHIQPQGGMPDMPITQTEARDMSAYLYTLR